MIIIGILIVLVLVGFILMMKSNNLDVEITGTAVSSISFFSLIVLVIVIIIVHATANNAIQKNKLQYEGLCKRYEIVKSEFEDVSESDVIADITKWNTKVYDTKYWSENPWTNWFNPKEVADNMEYIPLE